MLTRIRSQVRHAFRLGLRRPDVRKEDVDAELESFVEARVEHLMGLGMSAAEARAEAVGRLGGSIERARDDIERSAARRDRKLEARERLDALARDVRYALRGIGRKKAFSGFVIATLALGIAGTTTIYSVIHGVLIQPLPFPDPDHLITVSVLRSGAERDDMSPPDMADVLAQSPSITALVGFAAGSATLTGLGEPTVLRAARVSGGMLSAFGVRPALGRDITSQESGFGAAQIAVISYAFWRDRLGLSSAALGSSITLGGTPVEVVGVAPEGFSFPSATEVWVPHQFNSADSCGRACHVWVTVGRLAPDATVPAAQAEVNTIAAGLSRAYPESNARKGFRVELLQDRIVGNAQAALWVLLGAVSTVLLIACANAATLLLIRAHGRTGEAAVRTALGASRSRLATQIFAETAVFATIGGALGVALAYAGVALFKGAAGGLIPRVEEIGMSGSALPVVLGSVVAVAVLAGLLPAIYLTRAPVWQNLVHVGRGSDAGWFGRRSRNILIGLEVALAFVLLSGSGLLFRSFAKLYAVPLGFETRDIVRFTLSRGGQLEEMRAFFRTLEDRIGTIPGVTSVGSVYGAPLASARTTAKVHVEGRPDPEPGSETLAGMRAASPRYLQTMGIPLVSGRTLERSDDDAQLPVAVVNEEFVRQNFPGENPLGRQVRILTDQGYGSPTWTIVGVVGDIRSESLTRPPIAEIYVPHGQFGPSLLTVHVRSGRDPGDLVTAIRAEVRAIAPNRPLLQVETVAHAVRRETRPVRFLMLVEGLFAAMSVTLAAIGLYGALAFVVARRTHEIGVRLALGAKRGAIARSIVSEGMLVVACGSVVGVAVSLWSGRLLSGYLFGVTPGDPWTAVLAAVALVVAVSGAMLVPARRASRVDPMVALRAE